MLTAAITAKSFEKLHNFFDTIKTLSKICAALECKLEDIAEYVDE